MSKRILKALFAVVALACLTTARVAPAQEHTAASPHPTEGVAERVGNAAGQAAEHTTVGAAAEPGTAHEGHAEIDERLVPIPPSRDTLMTALWVIFIFVVMLIILYPTAWKNVLAGLKKREERIRKDIADAEEARLKAEATLKQYTQQIAAAERQVQDMLARATTEGDRIAAGIKAQAQKEVEDMRDRANRDIQATRDQALAQIYERAADLSTNIAAKIIRRNLNPDDQRDLVNQSLEQLQTVGSK